MIQINSSAEFSHLLRALADDVVNAHIHWSMFAGLRSSMGEHPLVVAQSNTFWTYTLRAHVAASMQHLCRVFDQEQSSLHLLSWLRTIKANLHIFEVDEFKKRLADNPYVESLAVGVAKPDSARLEADITLCLKNDPLVRKLVAYRGSRAAHRSARLALRASAAATDITLSDLEIETLLARAKEILNRYSDLFAAQMYSVSVIGYDDYKRIFSSVEKAVHQTDAEYAGLSALSGPIPD